MLQCTAWTKQHHICSPSSRSPTSQLLGYVQSMSISILIKDFHVSCTYYFIISELFRPFTIAPIYPSPHATPLTKAKLPEEPATSIAIAAAQRLRTTLNQFSILYADIQSPVFFMQVSLSVALETLPSASPLRFTFSPDAGECFITALRILHGGSKLWPVISFAALGVEQAAIDMQLSLPAEAEHIFEELKKDIARG